MLEDLLDSMLYSIISVIAIKKYIHERDEWKKFSSTEDSIPDLTISISQPTRQYGVDVLDPQPGAAALLSQNALLSANTDWSQAAVTLLEGREDGLEGALTAAIMTHLSIRRGLMFHASLVDVQGAGILFVGPSGIGKTTQAELWQQYRTAVIINGDMALVHEADGEFCGHGCPWHGSSPYCENRKVRLAGIVVLEQAGENRIRRLEGIKLVERMMKNVFLPYWYEPGVEAAMETLDRLLGQVPVYLFACRPEEEAVELLERTLFK